MQSLGGRIRLRRLQAAARQGSFRQQVCPHECTAVVITRTHSDREGILVFSCSVQYPDHPKPATRVMRQSHETRHATWQARRHTSHVTRHTSHVTRHTLPSKKTNPRYSGYASLLSLPRQTPAPAKKRREMKQMQEQHGQDDDHQLPHGPTAPQQLDTNVRAFLPKAATVMG